MPAVATAPRSVGEWEALVENLRVEQEKLERERQSLEDARRQHLLAAVTGDTKAKAKAEAASTRLAEIGLRLDEIGIALEEAGRRLEQARQAEAEAKRQAEEAELREIEQKRREAAERVDEAVVALRESILRYFEVDAKDRPLRMKLRGQATQARRYVTALVRNHLGHILPDLGFASGYAPGQAKLVELDPFVLKEAVLND